MAERHPFFNWYRRILLFSLLAAMLFASEPPAVDARAFFTRADLLFAITMAVVIHCPKLWPVGLSVLFFYLRDIYLMLPLGLDSMLMVLILEFLKFWGHSIGDNYLREYAFIGGAILTLFVLRALIYLLTFQNSSEIPLLLLGGLATLLIYPVVSFSVSACFLQSRKPDESVLPFLSRAPR